MGKSIYSLVLSDEIIELVDNVAYKKGVSRSTLVNDLLAEYVGYETPQMRIKSMFSLIDEIIMGEERMRLLAKSKESGFSIVSALNYKYSPRITYSIDLKYDGLKLGDLTISYRTSKVELIDAIESFFATWITLERRLLGYNVDYRVGDCKLKRALYNVSGYTKADKIAEILTGYVRNIDKELNLYLSESPLYRDELLARRFCELDTLGKV